MKKEDLTTFGKSRGVRILECDYRGWIDVHATICAHCGAPFSVQKTAQMVCENIEYYCRKLAFTLYGYCLMPDHLHVLLSPTDSQKSLSYLTDSFKSYTTHEYMKLEGRPPLWQRSWHDHVCRKSETAETVLAYVAENPVRAGLVDNWSDWPWTKVFIEL